MPQLENGYTRIADEILEKVALTKLNGTQLRILLIVWRSTYGWSKKEHDLSLGYLSKAIGVHKQQLKKELDKLIELKIITVTKEHTDTTPRVLGFNKNYANGVQSVKKSTVSENAYPTVSENAYPTVSKLEYQNKHINKHTNKQIHYNEIYNYYLTLDLIKHRVYTEDMTKAMKRAESELKIDTEYMKRMLKRHDEKVKATANNKFPIKARPLAVFFGQGKANSKSLICSDYLDEIYTKSISNGAVDSENNTNKFGRATKMVKFWED